MLLLLLFTCYKGLNKLQLVLLLIYFYTLCSYPSTAATAFCAYTLHTLEIVSAALDSEKKKKKV